MIFLEFGFMWPICLHHIKYGNLKPLSELGNIWEAYDAMEASQHQVSRGWRR